ncbi:MAG: C39 family peptidase [Candidatus Limimorpha sp.]
MSNESIHITDELIACYLEGSVTEPERAVVEAFLSDNKDALETVFIARAELAYQEDIIRQSVFAQSMIAYHDRAMAAKSDNMDCAIKAQQMVLHNYGIEISMEELTSLAEKKGWFESGKGSAFDFVGELLNLYGVESVQMRNAGIYHIMHELSQGHRIIVGVDSELINRDKNNEQKSLDTEDQQHVFLVAGIDTSNADDLQVLIKDPSLPEKEQRFSAKDFMERWKHTGCFMVATKQAAPLSSNPEMENFDYQLGYVRKFADMAYEEIVKRLAKEGFIANEQGYRKRNLRLYSIGILALLLLGGMGYYFWRISTPLQMKVNILEDKAYCIPSLPFKQGTLYCEYADNALQTLHLGEGNTTIFLNDIPYPYRKTKVHLVFESDGYLTIDTLVSVQKTLTLNLKRNNDLGVVFGRVIDFQTEQPVEGASVMLQDFSVQTDAFGQFRVEIPYEKQDKVQRVQVMKEGYQIWEGFYRPSTTEPWFITLLAK